MQCMQYVCLYIVLFNVLDKLYKIDQHLNY